MNTNFYLSMKEIIKNTLFGLFLIVLSGCDYSEKSNFSVPDAKDALDNIKTQYEDMYMDIEDKNQYPRSINSDGSTHFVGPYDWTSGFFPGSLWYLYQFTQDPLWKERAETLTAGLEVLKNHTSTHDLGFMMYCSFGNGLRLTDNEAYKDILIDGANSLISRYDSVVGCIKSWDWGDPNEWQFPVIIDNMMNLEFLCWATQVTGDSTYYNIAVSHANTTLKNHFRPDNSSFHLVDYDTLTGDVRLKITHQGFSDESSWARGQAWGFYGFTMMYRETKNKAYLDQAKGIADFVLNHPNLPADYIPYWDFNAPDIPNAFRDVSAAAIFASGLIEFSQHMGEEKGKGYLLAAKKILASLSSDEYLAENGENNFFILKHAVGNVPGNSEIDTPLIYADYYYIEALLRYIDLEE